jgi:photosystem II stability/assembly factor-like uncharacterized protein
VSKINRHLRRLVVLLVAITVILGVIHNQSSIGIRDDFQAAYEGPIDLSPAPRDINSLGDELYDRALVEANVEFSIGSEDDPLARDRWFWEQRALPMNHVPVDLHWQVVDQILAEQNLLEQNGSLQAEAQTTLWQELGPAPLKDISISYSDLDASGRALSIAIHPTNSNILLLGSAQGGIWKSTDAGLNFSPVSENMPSLAIKVIRFAPSNPAVLYAGTGEPHGSSSIYGRGLLKSIDGGNTWIHLPSQGNGWDFEGVAISGLQVHPSNANIIYVTTAHVASSIHSFKPPYPKLTGIFKSIDGGQTWTLLKAATEYPAWPRYLEGNVGFMDLELAISNPNLLYASEYFGGIWKTIDGGGSWDRITPLNSGGGGDFPALVTSFAYFENENDFKFYIINRIKFNIPEFDRIELGLAQSNPNILYAGYSVPNMYLDRNNDGKYVVKDDILTSAGLLFKSVDGGQTWSWLGDWVRGGVPNYCFDQCGYDNTLEVNPTNANDLLIGGSAEYSHYWPAPSLTEPTFKYRKPWSGMVYRSLDGGASWLSTTPHCIEYGPVDATSKVSNCLKVSKDKVVHPDIHAAAYNLQANRLYVATDGGLFRATLSGNGTSQDHYSWANLNNNLATLQFYDFDVHPTNPNIFLGGLQDNANAYWNGSTWEGWGGADGIFGAFDPLDPRNVYIGKQLQVFRHQNGGNKQVYSLTSGWKLIYSPLINGSDLFMIPFAIDPVATNQLYVAKKDGLYRSTDRGDSWSGRVNQDKATEGYPTHISISPKNNNYIWLGTTSGWVYLYNFQAGQYYKLGEILPKRWISTITPSPVNADTVYVTFSGYNLNTPTKPGKVFKSTDRGQTWSNISGNLPDVPVSAFAINPNNVNQIWVGTDVGVYHTYNGGATWSSYRYNMPIVAIMDLKYNATTGYLTVSTHGRGAWRIPIQETQSTLQRVFLSLLVKVSSNAPSPNPTATQPPIPTATLSPLPTATNVIPTATNPPPSLPAIKNPGFELGKNDDWGEYSSNSYSIITNQDLPISPHAGSWLAWFGGANSEDSQIWQTFNIPTSSPAFYMYFYYRLSSDDTNCDPGSADKLLLYINQSPIESYILCKTYNNQTWSPWYWQVNLGQYAGQQITMHIRVLTNSSLITSMYFDDFFFSTTVPQSSANGLPPASLDDAPALSPEG